MQVEMSLAELLMNAIGAGHVHGVQFKRGASDDRKTFEDLQRVISKRLDGARTVAVEEALRELHEKHPPFRLLAEVRRLRKALLQIPTGLACRLCGRMPTHAVTLCESRMLCESCIDDLTEIGSGGK